MTAVNLKALVGRLNEISRNSLEAAAGLCLSRTNYNVEIEHWFLKLMEERDTDLAAFFRRFEIDLNQLEQDLTRSIDRLKTGNSRAPALSQSVVDLAREAWLVASLDFQMNQARTSHLLYAFLSNDTLVLQAQGISREFERVSLDVMRSEFAAVTKDSIENDMAAVAEAGGPGGSGSAAGPGPTGRPGKTPALDQFTIELTERARRGEIDPVLGRDEEIRQLIDILTRRRQNNPILTGEAGVGKTAVVEGFALRIAEGDVHPTLKDVTLRTLDLSLLQAGAGVKGEFENRLKNVINEVKASPKPIILFIDEAHSLIGAGGQAGQGDAANLLKPALARGELRTIAATTWAEYKKYFERDAALARRFQVIKVGEPDEDVAIQIMRGLSRLMETHHNVRILDEALRDSVRLSSRYITGRQLPDKSVSLLDTACARVGLSQSATPPALEDCRRRIHALEVSRGIKEREHATKPVHEEELSELAEEKARLEDRLANLEERWKQEVELANEMRTMRRRLESGVGAERNGKAKVGKEASDEAKAGKDPLAEPLSPPERERLQADLAELNAKLEDLQGEDPLVQVCVDSQTIAEVVSTWTGIPVGRMVSDEIQTVLNLEEHLGQRIVGQPHALKELSEAIRTSRSGLTDPKRPVGVFLLVGTSGVGKTETAKALSELLYGGEQNMTVVNMSEFKEEHKISLLLGSPPGYVGYGEGGVLTEAVRRKPYSVVLLDELEKAHPGVQDIFYRMFDEGLLTDGEGREIDFRNTVILMTTNAGTNTIQSVCADPATMPDAAGLARALRPELLQTFKPAFLGRLSLLPYFPLGDEALQGIVRLKLKKIQQRVERTYGTKLEYSSDLVAQIASRCTEVDTGARNVDHILTRTLLPELASQFLTQITVDQEIHGVRVCTDENGDFRYEFSGPRAPGRSC